MDLQTTKLKRTLGFFPAFGAAVGLVVSGTAMFSVGTVAGTTGYATVISAFLALIPMMMVAFAFGELTAMIPGGGMISDYTLPALGRFWAVFSLLSGYMVLIATDGGAQLVMGGLAIESLTNIPQIIPTLIILFLVVIINITNVNIYGKIESAITIFMMVLFMLLSFMGTLHLGEMLHISAPVKMNIQFLPDGGWKTVFNTTGSAIWFFIGFEFACPMAEENKKPYKNIPYALIFGLIAIFLVDSLFAIAAVRYTNLDTLRYSKTPHIEAAKSMLGSAGYVIMTSLTLLASFTTANAYIAALPRMLYGLAREGLVPSCFGRINKKFRTPVYGIIFTSCVILITISYITFHKADTFIVQKLINTACITWMVSYLIAMIDVLVLRKKYPDFPRLWKTPFANITMPIGIVGVLFAIFTLKMYLMQAFICMLIIAVYCLIWGKLNNIKLTKIPCIKETVNSIRETSEPIDVWDQAIDEWCRKYENKY